MNAARHHAQLAMEAGMVIVPVEIGIDRKTYKKVPDFHGNSWKTKTIELDPEATLAEVEKYNGYAILCGPSNIVVVDLDRHDYVDGPKTWEQLGLPRSTYEVSTQSKARHDYYRQDPDNPVGTWSMGFTLGIDVRGIGGLVFGPGTQVTDGGKYETDCALDFNSLPLVPGQLLRDLKQHHEGSAPGGSAGSGGNFAFTEAPEGSTRVDECVQRVQDHVRMCELAMGGGFNNELNKLCFAVGQLWNEYYQAGIYQGTFNEQTGQEYVRQLLIESSIMQPADRHDEVTIRHAVADGMKDPFNKRPKLTPISMVPVTLALDPAERDSRLPVDLDPFLTGAKERPQPSRGLLRNDGQALLYPGKEHMVLGEMEAGKSWFLVASAAEEILAGASVIYVHFEDADETDTVQRLLDYGVPKEQIREQFYFIAPAEPFDNESIQVLANMEASLVVLDGVNEAYALQGWEINETKGAAYFRQQLVKPFTRMGAATIQADHVTKDRETRGRNAIGSVHKVNGITGSLITLENKEPFGRGQKGKSRVYINKDRPGSLRQHGMATALPGKTYMGDLVVDNSKPGTLQVTFYKPTMEGQQDGMSTGSREGVSSQDDSALLSIIGKLVKQHEEVTQNMIYGASGRSKEKTKNSIERLKMAKLINEHPASNNRKIFTLPSAECSGVPECSPVFP